MPGPHCPACASYEAQVMKANGQPVAADVKPCDAFVISDDFREWLVGQMRKEVLSQVSMSGLDRMAILKAGKGQDKAGAATNGKAPRNGAGVAPPKPGP